MAERASASRSLSFLPEGAPEFIRRRAIEGAGLLVFTLAMLLAVALLTYDPADPSTNNATVGTVTNALGPWGANTADLMMQWLGLAAFVPVALGVAWSWRLVRHHRLSWGWLHVAFVPMALILVSGFAASVPVPADWPLGVSFGGVLGDSIFTWLVPLSEAIGLRPPNWVFSLVLGGASLIFLYFSFGVSVGEWRAVGRGLRWLASPLSRRAGRAAGEAGQSIRASLTAGAQRFGRRKEPSLKAERRRAAPRVTPERSRETEPAQVPERRGPKVEPQIERRPTTKPGRRAAAERQPDLDLGPADGLRLPTLDLLDMPPSTGNRGEKLSEEALQQNARLLEGVLDDYGVRGDIVKVRPGPVVTLYELEPAPGVKTSRVIGLADDIARSMSAISARIAVIPGRNAIGIELPNQSRETVYLRELLATSTFESSKTKLTLALGKDIGGGPVVADLARMPHLLVAGTTGSGKSVAINTMILSLLYRLAPEQCRFIMVDPKMLELSVYDGIPHLLAPVVTEPGKAVVALKWTVREMEERYRKMAELGVRNIDGYNQRVLEAVAKNEELTRTVQTGFDTETGEPIFEERPLDREPLPLIVVIVDEMADLMMVAGKDIEAAVQRLAQMARASGIHLIMATQRPSVDVITGTIKANFPTRISFQVTSKIDSRTVLGEQGAEQLLGQGDMLYMPGAGRITRVHGPFVSDEEVEKVVAFLKDQGEPEYLDEITADEEGGGGFSAMDGAPGGEKVDSFYDQAVALVCRERKASTSFVQRHFQIGYNRAARIIEQMERDGVISQANHVGKREVLARDIDDRAT
ncbi:DNA translocase FtsK [Oceanibacterium hippocampi]|uniref:DNA translocase FtsK n=1 Tax=Oceanibacterium hippocampi TaxID=745714 RepID=A0A1Y5RJC6_9PROT|nr:DNA translocase FtsK [Oceanibacterium hippocampi]SLN16106.1 DNA translocase FtsK [Oceanibacterium hippocampi]